MLTLKVKLELTLERPFRFPVCVGLDKPNKLYVGLKELGLESYSEPSRISKMELSSIVIEVARTKLATFLKYILKKTKRKNIAAFYSSKC